MVEAHSALEVLQGRRPSHLRSRSHPRARRPLPIPGGLERDLLRAFDLVGSQVAIVDRTGWVLWASSSARRLLARGEGVALQSGHLAGEHPRGSAAIAATLKRALDAWTSTDDTPARHVVTVVSTSRNRTVRLVVIPLRRCVTGRLLVTFTSEADGVRLDPARIGTFYGMTPTEACLAASLAEGATVAGFATARGCSEHTVRTHLKRVLEKAGCGRQADLVRVLLTNPALHLE